VVEGDSYGPAELRGWGGLVVVTNNVVWCGVWLIAHTEYIQSGGGKAKSSQSVGSNQFSSVGARATDKFNQPLELYFEQYSTQRCREDRWNEMDGNNKNGGMCLDIRAV